MICLDWSADCKLLLVGCDDTTTRVFAADWIEGFALYALGSHKSAVVDCFFSDNFSADCYTLSRDGSLHVWNCSKKLLDFKVYQRGQTLYFIEDEMDQEDAKFNQKVRSGRFKDSSESNKKTKMDVSFSRSGKFSVETGSRNVDIICADYHKGSKLMVVGFSDGQFHIYELPEFMQIQALSISSTFAITAAKINSSGDWIAIGSQSLGQLLVWEWQSECYIMKQQSHASKHVVTAASFSPDEQLVVTGGNDSKVKLWQLKTSFCIVTFSEHTSTVTSVLFMQAGKAILSASLDGTVRAYDLKRYRNFKTLTSPRPAQFTDLCVDSCSDIVAACAIDIFEIFVWALQTGSILEIVSGHTSVVTSCRFAPVTNVLLSVSLDGFVRSWSIAAAKGGGEYLSMGSEVLALAVSPSGAEIAVSTSKANIHIIDLLIFEEKDQIQCRHDLGTGRGHKDQTTSKHLAKSQTFTSLSYSPDGLYLLAGGNSKYVCLYSVMQCLLVKRFTLSQNYSMDRMHELLDRRKMTEYGNKNLVDSESMEIEGKVKGKEIPLPGVKTIDLGERSFKAEMRSDQIEFSASGSSWVAATTEGCVVYSLDSDSLFDPYQLSTEISPQSTCQLVQQTSFQLALIYSLKLNQSKLVRFCVESTPVHSIHSVVSTLPTVYVFKLVNFLMWQLSISPLVEFYMAWCKSLLLFHRSSIKQLIPKKDLVTFNKAIIVRYEDLRQLCEPVGPMLQYYLAIAQLNKLGIDFDNNNADIDDEEFAGGQLIGNEELDSDSGLSDMIA